MELNEPALIGQLAQRDEAAFEQVFKAYFKRLHAYAFSIVQDDAAAEEMVQNVFFKLWERTESLQITGALGAYLYRAVNNESLNYIKHRKVRTAHSLYVAYSQPAQTEPASGQVHLKELEGQLRAAINDLPEQCRTIFQLSRFESLRYREIADRLGLSVKTVEAQMGKALKLLRTRLVDFLPAAVLCFVHLLKSSL